MLMQIFCQIVGNLVLISLVSTLFLYVGFKRHQSNYKNYLTYVTDYFTIVAAVLILFSTYFKSVESRFSTDLGSQSSQQDDAIHAHPMKFDIIDSRPFQSCDTNTMIQWRPDCLFQSLESSTSLNYSFKALVSNSTQESEKL